MAIAAIDSASHPGSADDRLFHIICSKAGISPLDLSEEQKRTLISDDQIKELWQQLKQRAIGHDSNITTKRNTHGQISPHLAEFERVTGVEGVHDQTSLTPERIAQTEAELENLNRKTQSLVDTLRSHNTRLNAIRDGGGSNVAANGGAKAALSSRAAELRARTQALTEECETLAGHADQRLDRYIAPSSDADRRDGRADVVDGSPAQSSASTQALREAFDGLLGPHDRILEKLDALCTELRFDDSEQKAVLQDARRLSNEIIFAIVAHQRMVLDIVFIQACKSYQDKTKAGRRPPPSQAKAASDEREVIVDDLRSLWDEVVPVAHMAVEKQLIGPIMKSKSSESESRDARYALIASYTSAMLGYMNERLEEFATRIKTLVAHHKALVKTFEVFRARTITAHTTNNNNHNSQPAQQQLNQASKTKRSSKATTATSNIGTNKPLEDLLSAIESLGVSLPPAPTTPNQNPGNGDAFAIAQRLDAQIQRRAAKSHVLTTEMQTLFEATAKTSITDALEATRMLADSLVAECSGGLLPEGQNMGETGAGAELGRVEEGAIFFADAELQKITADETTSVRQVAQEFAALLKDVNPGGAGRGNIVPYDFVADAYKSAVGTGQGGAGGRGREQHPQKNRRQIRDPKIHEIIERWGGRGDAGVDH